MTEVINKNKIPTPVSIQRNDYSLCFNNLYIDFGTNNFEESFRKFYEKEGLLDISRKKGYFSLVQKVYTTRYNNSYHCRNDTESFDINDRMRKNISNFGVPKRLESVRVMQTDKGLIYEFNSLHGPPFRYYLELSKQFPDFRFYSTCYDETNKLHYSNMGFHNGTMYDNF